MTDALTKAAQAALEALDDARHHMSAAGSFTKIQLAAHALRKALAAQQDEPVAWRATQGARTYYVGDVEFVRSSYDSGKFEPLYTHAAAQPQQAEPVAEVVEDDFSRQVKGIGRWHDLPNGTLLYAAAQPQQAASMDALTHQMIAALAAIDEALGLPADGCNSTAATLAAIRELKAAQQAVQMSLEDAVRAVVAKHGGVRAAERATGVDKSFISRLMNRHKVAPSEETLRLLGLRAVPLYEVFDAAAQPQQAAAIPREPTESMCRAAVEAAQGWPVSVSAADVWVAMWDAAREETK